MSSPLCPRVSSSSCSYPEFTLEARNVVGGKHASYLVSDHTLYLTIPCVWRSEFHGYASSILVSDKDACAECVRCPPLDALVPLLLVLISLLHAEARNEVRSACTKMCCFLPPVSTHHWRHTRHSLNLTSTVRRIEFSHGSVTKLT